MTTWTVPATIDGKMPNVSLENKTNKPVFNALRRHAAEHSIEEVGAQLRSMMSWIGASKIVDKTKN